MGPDVMFIIFFVLLLLLFCFVFVFFFFGGGGGGRWGLLGQIFILIPKLVLLERIESLNFTYTANVKLRISQN